MGRKATSLKSKATVPVPLPHDGPIRAAEERGESLDDNDIQQALKLLQDGMASSTTPGSIAVGLCQALKTATVAKTQLHALQSYKSKRLNLLQKNDRSSAFPCGPTTRGLYRLLLEWSLSADTSIPLQRAIQSNLSTMDTEKEEIANTVLSSLWGDGPKQSWRKPLHSLDVAVSNQFLLSILQTSLLHDCLSFIHRQWLSSNCMAHQYVNDSTSFAQEGLEIVAILKTLLNSTSLDDEQVPFRQDFETYTLRLMACPTMPMEGFNTLGIVYCRFHFNGSKNSPAAATAALITIDVLKNDGKLTATQEMTAHAQLSVVQGIAATLDSSTLVTEVEGRGSPLEACWRYSLLVSQVATDPVVRWAAIKGLSTLASRWQQQSRRDDATYDSSQHDDLVQDTLQVVLQAWENPPLRKLGTAIPGIFKTLVGLLSESRLPELCRTVLQQPVNRKGRYLALEILLPYFPPDESIQPESLLDGIGDRGPNTVPIADLWTKILAHVWETSQSRETSSFETWALHWVPSLSRALVDGELSRRKQVASFCIVRISDLMQRLETLQPYKAKALVLLMDQIGGLDTRSSSQITGTSEGVADRVLWAHLELSRQINMLKEMSSDVMASIASHLPMERLQGALTHSISSIRLAAFQSLDVVVVRACSGTIEDETDLWKYALPFSIKTTENKEYTSHMLQCLIAFLDQLSSSEATMVNADTTTFPNLQTFVEDFLIGEIVLKQGAYPGTPADKEGFIPVLLESLLTFVMQDQSYTSDNCVVRNGGIFDRKRSATEKLTMTRLLVALLQKEVFAALFALLHSIWDNTRATSFRVISKLVIASQSMGVSLPDAYCSEENITAIKARGLYLASSPRQREADTGARMLAFLYISHDTDAARNIMMDELVELLTVRLKAMKQSLQNILSAEMGKYNSAFEAGRRLPLAHGIVLSIFLAIEHQKNLRQHSSGNSPKRGVDNEMYRRLVEVFCQAIQLSLNIVADIRGGEAVDGVDELKAAEDDKKPEEKRTTSPSVPLNVNTSAIGANGTFSKLKSTDGLEEPRRLAIQRVVIGTWLLTKETCAAVSATVAAEGFEPPPKLVQRCGTLLISTLTSLKHTGAAFAARDSLQEIATACLASRNMELREIPEQWADRLFQEISSVEKVRDSTLRRSTGYALGFLALMRSELVSKSSSTPLCTRALKALVKYSLPAEEHSQMALESLGLWDDGDIAAAHMFHASAIYGRSSSFFLAESKYEARCRVHALNVLRMIILDAPLTRAVAPFIGDAIISALLGYSDSTWAVRNSATMVFSAAMLRVVDADKNASNTDRTSSQAITITEIFRRYPSLSPFLPAMMKQCMKNENGGLTSQLFPILLLLSRIQPVASSGGTAVSLAQPYPALIFEALRNMDHSVRAAAARSLANLCSEDIQSLSSDVAFLKECCSVVSASLVGLADWNFVDGALLSIESFLESSPLCRHFLRENNMYGLLLQVIRVEDGILGHPPSCRSTALNILVATQGDPADENIRTDLLLSCEKIIRHRRFESSIGGAALYANTARAIMKVTDTSLWHSTDADDFSRALNTVQAVLCSDILDVRLAGIKTFKKLLYQNIDNLLADQNRRSILLDGEMLCQIARTLLVATKAELELDDSLGPHIPTVRRLTRCYLECAVGFRATNRGGGDSWKTFVRDDGPILWATALKMLQQENFLDEPWNKSVNGETFLAGNAAELMSIVLAASDIDGGQLLVFSKVLQRLNNSLASWRSRYSAAIAIEISRVMLKLRQDESLQHDKASLVFLNSVITMLQDSDPDVQRCASRVALSLEHGKTKTEANILSLPSSALPVPTLCRLYPMVYHVDRPERTTCMAAVLLEALLYNCGGIAAAFAQLGDELRLTRQENEGAADLTNASSDRRIFEEEDPNPVNERLLTNQLATKAVLALPPLVISDNDDAPYADTMVQMLSLLDSSLKTLANQLDVGGMVHDLSRFPSVFSSLHGLISGVIASMYLGLLPLRGQTSPMLVEALGQSLNDMSDGSCLHPAIRTLLQCLAEAKWGDENTKMTLEEALFLVS